MIANSTKGVHSSHRSTVFSVFGIVFCFYSFEAASARHPPIKAANSPALVHFVLVIEWPPFSPASSEAPSGKLAPGTPVLPDTKETKNTHPSQRASPFQP